MADHHHPTRREQGPPPTPRQLAYLRSLALTRGVSFAPPRSKAEASRQIDMLKRRAPEQAADRRRELKAIRSDLANAGDAARIRDHELEGYGSTATWREVGR